MTDELPDDDAGHLKGMPTGYVYHAESIELVKGTVALACGAENGIAGKAAGCNYFNLTAFVADYLRHGSCVTSQRQMIDCGKDGRILQPLGQETGICDGAGWGEMAFVAWCARWMMTGQGEKPRETSFLWPYLGGRELSITGGGDSGALPSYSAKLYHDVGVLPVDCGGRYDLRSMPPHGANSQEALCIQMRDKPVLFKEWQDVAAPYKCRVFVPNDAETVADCIKTGRPVNCGCSYQAREAAVGSNGISPLYMLRDGWGRPAGHDTFLSGFFRLNGRLGYIKTESWWNVLFPGSKWPENRVTIQTDDGLQRLYQGQCALWADEWMSCKPELWAADAPGSR